VSNELQWSEPVLTQSQSVQFPIESAPHYLADLCKAIALEVQVPIELPYFAAVSVLAAATNGKIEVDQDLKVLRLVLGFPLCCLSIRRNDKAKV